MRYEPLNTNEALLEKWGNYICDVLGFFPQCFAGMHFLFNLFRGSDGSQGFIVVETCWSEGELSFHVVDSSFAPIPARLGVFIPHGWFMERSPPGLWANKELDNWMMEVHKALWWAIGEWERAQHAHHPARSPFHTRRKSNEQNGSTHTPKKAMDPVVAAVPPVTPTEPTRQQPALTQPKRALKDARKGTHGTMIGRGLDALGELPDGVVTPATPSAPDATPSIMH